MPDKGSIEEVHVMLCSSNSVENRVDVLLTEGGVMTKNFYLRQTQPAAAGYSLDAWCDASLLNDYDAGDEIVLVFCFILNVHFSLTCYIFLQLKLRYVHQNLMSY